MSSGANKWDAIFAQQSCNAQASDVLQQNIHLLPNTGTALDLACGLGGNAIHMAQRGLDVAAWDLSPVALEKIKIYCAQHNLNIKTCVRDIEKNPPEANKYDVIIVSNFLYRPIFANILASLKKHGILLYQTFTAEKVNSVGPSNPDYLLARNELLSLCLDMNILVYREEGLQGDQTQGWRNQAMVVAQLP